jgi:hypothetical protein
MISGTQQTKLSRDLEDVVSQIERQAAIAALAAGHDIVIDAMNLRHQFLKPWLTLGHDVQFHDFPVSLDLALARNDARGGKVPEDVIRKLFRTLTKDGELPRPPRPFPKVRPYVSARFADQAVICDIDGTLAHTVGRSPYDMTRVSEDDVDPSVANILRSLADDYFVILMSGRTEFARADTEAWLQDHQIPSDLLLMRANGDERPDTVMKAELFDTHVRNTFNVIGVIDDRPSVCRMWRAVGLKVLQVGDPHKEF